MPAAPLPIATLLLVLALGGTTCLTAASAEPGLLFHLSADRGTTADYSAAGTPEPSFVDEITTIADGASGPALHCGNIQRLSWSAPGNVYAQRGTVSFFWRAREPVGPTEFPLFRIAFADHSSWDMVFLRLDYNGHGFDAFVTDTGLARIRVSSTLQPFPAPTEWIHLAFTWDETVGVRLYVNGRLAAAKDQRALLDAGLDQFGPHSRIISPHQVQSDYNFVRGGDLDELRLYDRMLDAEAVSALARKETPPHSAFPLQLQLPTSTPAAAAAQSAAWAWRHGWNRPDDLPPPLPATFTSVRKVEIHDAYDLKRWWWKANDGIRETTWPGVYNRSRLPGRNDYFQLPDWDCYVESGRAISFTLPAEPVNHLEITGPAWGTLEYSPASPTPDGGAGFTPANSPPPALLTRPQNQARTTHRLATPLTGGALRFTNTEQETPIEEFATYHVTVGREPIGRPTLAYRVEFGAPSAPSLVPLAAFIRGRHPDDEQAIAVAVPASDPVRPGAVPMLGGLPVLNILIPAAATDPAYDLAKIDGALDGIALDLPIVGVTYPVSLNIRVKDPLWPARDLLDFSFTLKPGETPTLWLDLRDRLLPADRGLYLTIAASAPLDPAGLAPALRLVFKPAAEGRAEHVADRFAQVRDTFAMWVEERPRVPRYALYRRLVSDLRDLLRADPAHFHGLCYGAALGLDTPRPPFPQPEPPTGVPLWAFRQTELLRRLQYFAEWYVDQRQVPYGDLGGGISDDTDLTNYWPGLALMGCAPNKLSGSVSRLLDAAYANGMFDRGLSAIQTDELHSYEEGINCLGQALILDHGSPRQLERAMETTRALYTITGVNTAGHRHLRSSYYSGSKIAEEGVWGWARPYGHLVFQIPSLLADYNGAPSARQLVQEVADGLLAHRHLGADGNYQLPSAIHFATDQQGDATRSWLPWPLFCNAWQWTGERRYLDPVFDLGVPGLIALNANVLDLLDLRAKWGPRLLAGERGRPVDSRRIDRRGAANGAPPRPERIDRHFAWQLTGDKTHLTSLYADQLEYCALNEFINTEGSLWTDRPAVPLAEIQRARLGGIALLRNATFPGHVVSWRFTAPATATSVAVLINHATTTSFTVVAYNLAELPVRAELTGGNVEPGQWTVTQGLDTDNDDTADGALLSHSVLFERSRSVEVTFAPRATTVLTFKRTAPGTPYWQRPDLGLDPQDVVVTGRTVRVTAHSLGSVPTPATTALLRDAAGRTLATATVTEIPAPLDLFPKTASFEFAVPAGADLAGASVVLNPDEAWEEITRRNNSVRLE